MTAFLVQQHQDPGTLEWESDLWAKPMSADPAHHLADLARRRRHMNVTHMQDGLEFDGYHPAAAPCREMAGMRVRIWCVTADSPEQACGMCTPTNNEKDTA